MTRGTTPTITVKLPQTVLVSDIDVAHLALQQNGELIKCAVFPTPGQGESQLERDVETNSFSWFITQEETLSLMPYTKVNIQLKVKIGETVMATQIVTKNVNDILCGDTL